MSGSESVAKTAVSSAKVAVVVSGEVGRSEVYRRGSNDAALGHTRFYGEEFGVLLHNLDNFGIKVVDFFIAGIQNEN
jgi:hypothetical protein